MRVSSSFSEYRLLDTSSGERLEKWGDVTLIRPDPQIIWKTPKDSEWDKDIYVTFALGENEYDFCVENYLTAPDTDLYKAVEALKEGDVVNVTGFLYWYEGPNTHITAIEAA